MTNIGDIKRDKDYRKYIWKKCIACGIPRWVVLYFGVSQSPRCRQCAPKERLTTFYKRGKDNPSWKCGWKINKDGYKEMLLQPDSFFYPMAKKDGYVLEHRLIVAQLLGRCLHRWEIVHHKEKPKTNNCRSNLQLVTDDRHNQITILETRITHLEKRITLLEAENVALRAENKFQIS